MEYALLVALIAAVAIGGVTALGDSADKTYQEAAYNVASPEPTTPTTVGPTPTTIASDDDDDDDRWCPWWAWWRDC